MQDDYPSSAVALLIVAAVFTALPTIAVALRIAGRRIKHVPLWLHTRTLEELFISLISSPSVMYGFMILLVLSVTNGDIGRPSHTIPPHTLVFLNKAFVAIQFLWVAGITLAKFGILFFYLRFFPKRQDRIFTEVMITEVMIGVTACWGLAGLVAFFCSCQPFSYNWNSNQEGNCDAKFILWIVVAAAHMVIEIIILLLPLPMVWKRPLSLRKKLEHSVLFTLGIFVCIISAIRIYMLQDFNHGDFTKELPIPHIWSFLEPTIAICTSSLPMARLFFAK